jgi:hypothetical protein
MEYLRFDLKHLVAMNSMLFGRFLPSARFAVNPIGSTPILFTKLDLGFVYKFVSSPRSIKFSILGIRSIHCA